MSEQDFRQIVAQGYDRIAGTYDRWAKQIVGDPRVEWTGTLLDGLPEMPDILELGSGGGVEPTPTLARHGQLTGVDISGEQIRLASSRVPGAHLIQGDVTEIDFPPDSFDAVVALYVFNHIPSECVTPLFQRIGCWLRPSGRFLGTFTTEAVEGRVEEWLGTPMFFDNYHPEETRRAVNRAGLTILREDEITTKDPLYGDSSSLWLMAEKRVEEETQSSAFLT